MSRWVWVTGCKKKEKETRERKGMEEEEIERSKVGIMKALLQRDHHLPSEDEDDHHHSKVYTYIHSYPPYLLTPVTITCFLA